MVRTRERRKILEETHPAFCQLQEYLEREGVPVMNDGNFTIDSVNENPLSATLLRNTLHGDYIESSHMMDIVVSSIAAIGCDRKSKAN